jgi:hypothetical protein
MMNLSRVFQALALLSISALISAQTKIQGSGASTLSPLFGTQYAGSERCHGDNIIAA